MHAIYNSMNSKERKNPDLIDGNRRRRIAAGAGVQSHEISQFIKQFEMTRGVMRSFSGMGVMGKMKAMKQIMGGGLAGGGGGGPILRTKKSGFMEKKDRNKKKKR
jgi:signal recognition particle subunit SRP54